LVTACPTEDSGAVSSKPIITQQPTGFQAASALLITVAPIPEDYYSSAILTVEAETSNSGIGGGPLTYQWYYNATDSNSGGTEVPNAKGATLKPSIKAVSDRWYFCEVKNGSSSVRSETAHVVVYDRTLSPAPTYYDAAAVSGTAVITNTNAAPVTRGSQAKDLEVSGVTIADANCGGVLHYKWFCEVNGKWSEVGKDSPKYRPSTAGKGTYSYSVLIWNENAAGTDSSGYKINGITKQYYSGTITPATVTIN
jgi:hypothetical protein